MVLLCCMPFSNSSNPPADSPGSEKGIAFLRSPQFVSTMQSGTRSPGIELAFLRLDVDVEFVFERVRFSAGVQPTTIFSLLKSFAHTLKKGHGPTVAPDRSSRTRTCLLALHPVKTILCSRRSAIPSRRRPVRNV